MTWEIRVGDVLYELRKMPDESVRVCVTSPPYWGLRDYGVEGQLGLEPTPEEYVTNMVEVFREVRRVLAVDGTLWLNLGDSYAGSWRAQSRGGPPSESSTLRGNGHVGGGPKAKSLSAVQIAQHPKAARTGSLDRTPGLKPKDLVGIPWRVAFALQADGWWLRSDIIWAKPNPMPESVTDRPTKAHEYLFLLSKSERYFYDHEAVAEPLAGNHEPNHPRTEIGNASRDTPPGTPDHTGLRAYVPKRSGNTEGKYGDDVGRPGSHLGRSIPWEGYTRNRRSVWTITTKPYPEAHFATFPPELPEVCIKAGSAEGDTVLDPFAGAGTTGMVALRLKRSFIGIDLNPDYAELARQRIDSDAPLFNRFAEATP